MRLQNAWILKAVIFVYVDKATLVVWMYDNVKVYIEYIQYSRLKTYTCTACTVLQNINMHIRYTYC